MGYELTVTDSISPEDEKAVETPLVAYNIETFGKSDKRDLSILLRDAEGKVEGGLIGYTARSWLYVRLLFVPESARGEGLGPRMLALAEEEARRRGCIGAYLDTMNPKARQTYLRCGYTVIGEHGPLTGGMSITWLSKRFAVAGDGDDR